jgi:nucleoside-diphosphate-sugar epimerase
MITGSGLLANAFATRFATDPANHIYAAGVSNSACADGDEFERERTRLALALREAEGATFVYFGTCSVYDPSAQGSPYVRHKLAMENFVATHERYLIVRLPQVAGRTPNPHTLLNYLFARISRSEAFSAWKNATRNIIDVEDVVVAVSHLIAQPTVRRQTRNVANPRNASVAQIVAAMEVVVGKAAIVRWIGEGSSYPIDVETMLPVYRDCELGFDESYLGRVIEKYYGDDASRNPLGRSTT